MKKRLVPGKANIAYSELLEALGIDHITVADTFDVTDRTSRKFAGDPRATPSKPLVACLMLMKRHKVDAAKIKQMLKGA